MGQSEESQPLVGGSTSRPRGGGGFGVKSVAAVCAVMALYLLAPYLRPSAQLPGNTVKRILPAPSLTYRDENERLREQIAELQAKLKKRQEAKDEKEVAQMGAAAAAAAELQRQAQQPPQQAVASHPPETASHPPAASNASVGRAAYRLTRELIRSRCNAHNIILVTFVNFQRCDYGLTWSGHVVRLGLSNYLVGAMDGKALELLASKQVPTFDMESGLTTADYGWGTKNFRKLGLRKCELILSLLSAGADPIVTDADALITRDPTPFVMRLRPEAQVLVTSDHLMATDDAAAESLELPKRASSSAWNIGYFYLHHSALPAIAHWKRMCEEHPDLWDQNLFKDVFKIGRLRFETSGADAIPQAEVDKRLFRGYNGTVTIGILPVATFCGGHTYFVQRMPQRRGVVPYSVHTTFQYSGAVGKTHRLREAMLWADDAAYFDPPGRSFLTYVPVVRRELLRPAGVMGVAAHFEVVHHQLVQLRAAFLLAARLGRLLIVPPLTCGLDRFWAPHNGTIPGSDTRLPVEPCPLDHVLDLENGISKHALPDSRLARDPAGRPLGGLEGVLREYSFLNNSRTPDAVRQSLAFPDPPADLSAASLAPLAAATARVLHFARMPDLYATLPPADATRVRQEMMWYTTLWCCSKPAAPKTPGHIFYDIFFDVVPHTDKSRREWTEPWTPKFGP